MHLVKKMVVKISSKKMFMLVYWKKEIIVLDMLEYVFFEKKIYFTQRNKSTKKNYIPILQNLYTHTMEMQYIIYMQEACGPPHIDHYRSKLCSLYTSNDQL